MLGKRITYRQFITMALSTFDDNQLDSDMTVQFEDECYAASMAIGHDSLDEGHPVLIADENGELERITPKELADYINENPVLRWSENPIDQNNSLKLEEFANDGTKWVSVGTCISMAMRDIEAFVERFQDGSKRFVVTNERQQIIKEFLPPEDIAE